MAASRYALQSEAMRLKLAIRALDAKIRASYMDSRLGASAYFEARAHMSHASSALNHVEIALDESREGDE